MLFIFDMGGVVTGNVHAVPAMAKRLGISEKDFYRIASVPDATPDKASYNHGLLAELQKGEIGSVKFWKQFRHNADNLISDPDTGSLPVPKTIREENLWETCFSPEPIMLTIEIIKDLKAKGHRVVCGTNTLDAHYAVHKKNGDYAIFDAVYASHLMGMIKPNREFFDRILEKEHELPENTYFIDDNELNVEASLFVGIHGIHFTSAEKLKEELSPFYK